MRLPPRNRPRSPCPYGDFPCLRRSARRVIGVRLLLGRRQVVRHWILIPAFEGSIPSAPASRFSYERSELEKRLAPARPAQWAGRGKGTHLFFPRTRGPMVPRIRPAARLCSRRWLSFSWRAEASLEKLALSERSEDAHFRRSVRRSKPSTGRFRKTRRTPAHPLCWPCLTPSAPASQSMLRMDYANIGNFCRTFGQLTDAVFSRSIKSGKIARGNSHARSRCGHRTMLKPHCKGSRIGATCLSRR